MAADTQTTPTGPGRTGGGRENVLTRKLGPLPTWVWVAIIGAAVVIYSLWKGRKGSSSSAGSDAQNGPSHKSFGASLIPPVVVHARGGRGRGGDDDDQDDDDDDGKGGHGHRRKRKRHKKHGGVDPGGPRQGPPPKGGPNPGGPNIPPRHHDDDADRDDRQHEQEKRPARVATRAVPGGTPFQGALMSFTTPQAGVSPSLAQVASNYGTTPDAIVEEATGRGSPHGALWRRYVSAHDWQAPLPHGTDMTILSRPQ